jgi:hypothetical protein
MSYFQCPDCGKRHHIFGNSHIDSIAQAYDIDKTAMLPIDSSLAEACDTGRIEDVSDAFVDAVKDFIV